MSKLETIGDIARRKGVSDAQAKYAVRVAGVKETQRLGVIRAFGPVEVELIERTLDRIARSHPNGSPECSAGDRHGLLTKPGETSLVTK